MALTNNTGDLCVETVGPEPAEIFRFPTFQEEIANSITHGIGLALSIAGLVFLVLYSSEYGTVWHVVGCSIYGGSLVALYGVSTLYHGLPHEPSKEILRVVDHVCIYLLIAGSYTPFTLTVLRVPWGWTLLGIVWALAIWGIVSKIVYADMIGAGSALPYLAMGWLGIIAAKPIADVLPLGGILWLVAGGLLYTIGVVFYTRDDRPFFHAVWHVFVLAASVCHYIAVMFYVVPSAVS